MEQVTLPIDNPTSSLAQLVLIELMRARARTLFYWKDSPPAPQDLGMSKRDLLRELPQCKTEEIDEAFALLGGSLSVEQRPVQTNTGDIPTSFYRLQNNLQLTLSVASPPAPSQQEPAPQAQE